jgi:hypothetical protein
MHRAALEPLLETPAQVVAPELRKNARPGRRLGRHDDLGDPPAVAALVSVPLAQDRLLGPAPEPAEQPG